MKVEQNTLALVIKEGQILLGMKKRGIGSGRWNGFGGKLEKGETILDATTRELQEEAGIVAQNLEHRGILHFTFTDSHIAPLDVILYLVASFEGLPIESDEMRPQWFSVSEIPYDLMWPDDKYWLPQVIAGHTIEAFFHFTDFDTLISQQVLLVK